MNKKTKTSLLQELLQDEWQVKALNLLFDAAHHGPYDNLDLRYPFAREVDHIRRILHIGRYSPNYESVSS